MTTRYNIPAAEALGPARQLFDAISTLQSLGDGGKPAKIAFARLYAFATDPDGGADPEVERLLEEDPDARRDFRRLLEKTAYAYLPRVAAASTGGIGQRTGANCRIRFEASRAEPDQTYVIIEVTDSGEPDPTALFVCDTGDRCDKFPLPRGRDGIVQLLLESDSELLAKLRNIETEIYLG